MNEEQVIQAFHAMWDNFPEPVTLIKKNRDIYAVNNKAASLGLKGGAVMKCSQVGAPQDHKGCRCNEAVDDKKAIGVKYETPLGKAFGYWIPVAGCEEFIIHFSVGAMFDYEELKR